MNELKPLTFLSATSILKWARQTQIEYLSNEGIFYIEKDGVFYYFSKTENEYHLIMTSNRNLENES